MAGLLAGIGIILAPSAGAEQPAAAAALPARYTQQTPNWHRCQKDQPEDYQCATVTVPLDYQHPHGATIDVAISRIKTSDPAKHRGILLFNRGGPSLPGLDRPAKWRQSLPKDVLSQYDLVGFDPRGVGKSSSITCGLADDERPDLPPYKAETFAADTALARSVGEKCGAHSATIAHITTRNTARDMDVIRAVLGEKKLSYLGYSYGTYLGAVYMQLFPQQSDRMVLDSAVDPGLAWRGMVQSWAVGSKPAFERWTRYTAQHAARFGLGTTPAEVAKAFWDLVAHAERTPIDYQGQKFTGDKLREAMRRLSFSQEKAAKEIVNIKKAAAGQPVDPPPANPAATLAGVLTEPAADSEYIPYWAIFCNEGGDWPRDPEQYRRDAVRDKVRYPLAGDVMSNITPCAFWSVPRIEQPTQVNNTVGALIVHNEWDSQTPLYTGLGMHKALKSSRLVYVEEGEGHGVFLYARNTCVDSTVNSYLSTGVLPAKNVTCAAQAQPEQQTRLDPPPKLHWSRADSDR